MKTIILYTFILSFVLFTGCQKICPCKYGHEVTTQMWIDGFPYDVTSIECDYRPNCVDSLKSIWN